MLLTFSVLLQQWFWSWERQVHCLSFGKNSPQSRSEKVSSWFLTFKSFWKSKKIYIWFKESTISSSRFGSMFSILHWVGEYFHISFLTIDRFPWFWGSGLVDLSRSEFKINVLLVSWWSLSTFSSHLEECPYFRSFESVLWSGPHRSDDRVRFSRNLWIFIEGTVLELVDFEEICQSFDLCCLEEANDLQVIAHKCSASG